ncbi:MAG: serine protease [Pirellulaceae bacterium]
MTTENSVVQVLSIDEGLGVICGGYIFTATHCLDVDYEGGITLGQFRYQKCKTCDGEDFLADLLFVDAVSDLAVLCCPDRQSSFEQAEAYERAIDGRGIALFRGEVPSIDREPMAVRIRNKHGWVEGSAISTSNGRVFIDAPTQIFGGASGGPVITVTGDELVAINSEYSETGMACDGVAPWALQALPYWFAHHLLAENGTD